MPEPIINGVLPAQMDAMHLQYLPGKGSGGYAVTLPGNYTPTAKEKAFYAALTDTFMSMAAGATRTLTVNTQSGGTKEVPSTLATSRGDKSPPGRQCTFTLADKADGQPDTAILWAPLKDLLQKMPRRQDGKEHPGR